MNKCEHYESNEAKVHIKMEATSMRLCNKCYNALMSEELEVDLVQPVDNFSLKDYQASRCSRGRFSCTFLGRKNRPRVYHLVLDKFAFCSDL